MVASDVGQSEQMLKALADATRRRIVQVLLQHELTVSDLVVVLRQPQSTVSRHLKVLRGSGLIQDRREGTTVVYALPDPRSNGGGGVDLRARLLGWLADQTVPTSVSKRLDAVLRGRQARSESFFAQVGRRWDQMREDCFGSAFQFEALTALLPREWTVADVGTGTGYLLPLLSRRFDRVIAVDSAPAMLDLAKGRPGLCDTSQVEFRLGDVSDLPIEGGQVDLCLASLVLHHVPSPATALAEMARVTKAGGRLLMIEQQAHQFEAFYEMMQDRTWGFEPQALAQQVEQAGFGTVEWSALTSAEQTHAQAPDAPELFVMTAMRKDK